MQATRTRLAVSAFYTPPSCYPTHRLTLHIKLFIGPETYTKYRTIIEKLVLRGERQLKIRNQYRPQLEDLVRNEDGIISLHNGFAKEHNARFKAKHDRWLFPVYEEPRTDEVKETSLETEVEKCGEEAQDEVLGERKVVGEHIPISRCPTSDENPVVINHIDGTLDADTNMDDYLENSANTNSIIAAENTMDELGRGAALIRQIEQNTVSGQDVEMRDIERLEPIEDTVPSLSTTKPCADPALNAREDQSSAHDTGNEPLDQKETQDLEVRRHEEISSSVEQRTVRTEPNLRSTLGVIPPSSNNNEPERTKAAITGNPGTPELVVGFEESDEQTRLSDATITIPPHSPMHVSQDEPLMVDQCVINALHPNTRSAPDPYSMLKQSATSYLAWLRQRRTRFPSARPVYPECVAIGKLLGRSPHKTYDEILYHWGLEIDSKYGAWYRQRRHEVLGEDPIFPDELLDFLGAPVKEGSRD